MPVTSSSSPLHRLKQAVYPLTRQLVARSWVAEGALGGAGDRVRVLFVHNCLFNQSLQRRTLPDGVVSSQQHLLLLRLPGIVRRNPFGVDLVCAVVPRAYDRLFRDIPCYRTREEVRQVITTKGTWEDLRKGFSKKRRQISNDFEAKNGLTHRISEDPADFDLFYHRMYVPHVRRRYGDLAEIDSYADMKAAFSRGMLLLVLSGGTAVAGALSVPAGDALMFRRTGVLDGDESYVKVGAQTALYYFQLRYAVEHGLASLDTMKSAPFLNDGVFRHKADWGARAIRDEEAVRSVLLFPLGPQDRMARFFELNPTILDDGVGLRAAVGDTTADRSGARTIAQYPMAGIGRVELLHPSGSETVTLDPPVAAA